MNVADLPPREGLAEALARLHSRRVLLICGPSRRYVERLAPAFAGLELEVFAGARRHVPQELLAQARQKLDAFQADTVVALGGGSAIGFGKALRLDRDVHFVAVPTTYAGSEMTTLWGTTHDGVKTTGRDPRVRPDVVIHDVDLTVEMPKPLTVTSLMNALAHPISALGSGSLTGDAREQALAAITAVYGAIEALVRAPTDRRARREAARGAGLAAAALEAGKPGPHHALAHRLGGRFDLDHGGLHSVLLPHSLRRLRDESPELVAELSARLSVADVEDSLFEFLQRAGAATSLRALGVSLEGLTGLLEESPELPRALLRAAFHGRRPSGATRFEDWGLSEPVSVRGPQPESARRVIIALHGRGAAADSILARTVEIVGNDPTVCVLAPQATDNVWYTGRYNLSRNELGAALQASIGAVESLLTRVLERSAADRVVLFGFSQGACLALEVTARLQRPIAAVVALSGASIGLPAEQPAASTAIAGLPVRVAAVLILAAIAAVGWAKREYIEELPIGCGFKAKTLCAGVFVQGLPVATIEREDTAFNSAFGLMKARIDTARKSVTCSILGTGLFARTAVYVEGLGPVLLSGRSEKAVRAMAPPPRAAPSFDRSAVDWPDGDREPAGPAPTIDESALKAAMDGLFAESDPKQLKRTRAALVVYRGRIVAERYADGISKDTRLLSWSMAKSFTNALVGILVKQGKLDIKAPAPVPEWKKPGDPRSAITTDMLMRMSSGLSWEEDYTDHPVSDVNRMLYLEPDAAAFAVSKRLEASPDTLWSYSSGSTNIVSRVIRSIVGNKPDGGEAEYLAFPHRELFDKIGMRDVVFGVDASGTLIGSSYLYATARDFARFGLLCLGDGAWKGRRILPELWITYATTPTPAAPKGQYGAFFWLNKGSPGNPGDRELPGMPADLYYADGYQGQRIFVCPSLDLVAVRLGMTWSGDWGEKAFLEGIRKAIGK